MLLDVRPRLQYSLMHLTGSVNVPLEELEGRMAEVKQRFESSVGPDEPLLVICRRGNASQKAVMQLRDSGIRLAIDVVGGLTQWSKDLDPEGIPIL